MPILREIAHYIPNLNWTVLPVWVYRPRFPVLVLDTDSLPGENIILPSLATPVEMRFWRDHSHNLAIGSSLAIVLYA